ncbi:ATP synthase F1 subunit gamma [Mycoplasma leonicaptivi]|uniref:ATP synthase F1 subunit gamma n=1 Tax=Mycoplasma leonicaptivi TaxID=36742 RepID=UPI000484A892|nr:ATP synthase F1 subunit gamma [Mycoplasma leonicaptivi]
MPNLNSLKNRINVVTNTQKITNAMELVSTAKLRRLRNEYEKIAAYHETLSSTFEDLISHIDKTDFELVFPKNTSKNKLHILISSDLGLCGSYNHNVYKLLETAIQPEDKIVVIGTKGFTLLKSSKYKNQILMSFINVGDQVSYEIGNKITQESLKLYFNNKISEIVLYYTEFVNNLVQNPVSLTLFPFNLDNKKSKIDSSVIEFEPNAETVLLNSVPLYLASMIFSLGSNSKISEMASRRNAMENATNNAEDLIENLKLEFNRERQSIITQEITEIVAGADAT